MLKRPAAVRRLVSTMAGIRLFGEIFKNSGSNCSPLPILIGLIL